WSAQKRRSRSSTGSYWSRPRRAFTLVSFVLSHGEREVRDAAPAAVGAADAHPGAAVDGPNPLPPLLPGRHQWGQRMRTQVLPATATPGFGPSTAAPGCASA